MTDATADPGDRNAILSAAVAGDESAFALLYRDTQPRLRRYAWALVGQDADDVTAEAWLQIAQDLRSFRGDADGFRAWAARIVRNRAIDHVRAQRRRPVELTDRDEALDSADSNASDEALDRVSTYRAVSLIAQLPRDQAEAVLLRVVVGLDSARAGEVLGKSAVAVRVAAHRGLKTLAKRLGAAETDGEERR